MMTRLLAVGLSLWLCCCSATSGAGTESPSDRVAGYYGVDTWGEAWILTLERQDGRGAFIDPPGLSRLCDADAATDGVTWSTPGGWHHFTGVRSGNSISGTLTRRDISGEGDLVLVPIHEDNRWYEELRHSERTGDLHGIQLFVVSPTQAALSISEGYPSALTMVEHRGPTPHAQEILYGGRPAPMRITIAETHVSLTIHETSYHVERRGSISDAISGRVWEEPCEV